MTINENIILKMKNKTIDTSEYNYISETLSSIKLTDKIILYNTENQWKIIPLELALSYPIMYDKYMIDDQEIQISIILCPITLRCVILRGIFEFETYDNYRMILREKDTESFIPIDMGSKIDKRYVVFSNKRLEAMILTLRSSLSIAQDAIYMQCDKKIDLIIEKEYYENWNDVNGNKLTEYIHPKTLIYVIQYKSYSKDEDKISLILGKDSSSDKITGYDIVNSGLYNYLGKHRQKIITRSGYIIPMLWCTAREIYQKSRVVYLF